MLRSAALALYRGALRRRAKRWSAEELRRPAVVFSPHFDDETLGCGGTMFQKRRAGAEVAVVFMTDGSTSHQQFMPADELRRLRSAEGFAAAAALGLRREDVYQLGFLEGRLREYQEAAVEKIVRILVDRAPEEVYLPYEGEPLLWSEDHLTTTRVVKAALARWGRSVVVHEYPIWFYRHWPWTGWSGCGWEKKVFLRLGLSSPLGLGLFWRLGSCRDVSDVLKQKGAALDEHRTQMQRQMQDGRWPTLSDVAGGDFLKCFLREYEVFQTYSMRGAHASPQTTSHGAAAA